MKDSTFPTAQLRSFRREVKGHVVDVSLKREGEAVGYPSFDWLIAMLRNGHQQVRNCENTFGDTAYGIAWVIVERFVECKLRRFSLCCFELRTDDCGFTVLFSHRCLLVGGCG